ncbi:duboraya isoform X3 [Acanthochromis polyacanthus]|uniref:duboraya isoform X3 n=1 Tax=Acanthochromis polyacanthus TaxID=80966 RepID=UPI002234C149|nr:duboraya isoform X3 [Acanthochromis polyacanthus]
MEEEAPSHLSVAELAGRFKGSAPPQNAAGNGAEKPVRRRPPRTLQLPKPDGDNQEPPSGVTSPLPAKAKRNSALIEKLQANLVLSPSAHSPKSPGFRLLPPSFTPASPGSAPITTVPVSSSATPTSPVTVAPVTKEEGPASFEAPPTASEGSILSSINKGRPRHSIRRRPPSRRHRKSSCGDDVGVAGDDATETQPSEAEDKATGGQEGPTDVLTPPEEHQTHGEDEPKSSSEVKEEEDETKSSSQVKEEEDETKSSSEVKEEEDETKSSSQVKEEEDGPKGGEERSPSDPEEEKKQDSTEVETKTDDRKEKENEEATCLAR